MEPPARHHHLIVVGSGEDWRRRLEQQTRQKVQQLRSRAEEMDLAGRWESAKVRAAQEEVRLQGQAAAFVQGRSGPDGLPRPRWVLVALGLLLAAAVTAALGSWLFLRGLPRMANTALGRLFGQPETEGSGESSHAVVDRAIWTAEFSAGQTLATGTLLLAVPTLLLYLAAVVCLWLRVPGSRAASTVLAALGAAGALVLLAFGSFAFILPAVLSVAAVVVLWCRPCHAWYAESSARRRAQRDHGAWPAGPGRTVD